MCPHISLKMKAQFDSGWLCLQSPRVYVCFSFLTLETLFSNILELGITKIKYVTFTKQKVVLLVEIIPLLNLMGKEEICEIQLICRYKKRVGSTGFQKSWKTKSQSFVCIGAAWPPHLQLMVSINIFFASSLKAFIINGSLLKTPFLSFRPFFCQTVLYPPTPNQHPFLFFQTTEDLTSWGWATISVCDDSSYTQKTLVLLRDREYTVTCLTDPKMLANPRLAAGT
jgi:hypothetical protein